MNYQNINCQRGLSVQDKLLYDQNIYYIYLYRQVDASGKISDLINKIMVKSASGETSKPCAPAHFPALITTIYANPNLNTIASWVRSLLICQLFKFTIL